MKTINERMEPTMSKLVTVFSYSGKTKAAAEKIAKEIGANVFEIKAKAPYTTEDVNWRDENSRCITEWKNADSRPEVEELPELDGVDELWIGYPIWCYVQPRIINSFIEGLKLDGVKIHLFATSGTHGIEQSADELKKTYPDVDIVEAKRV